MNEKIVKELTAIREENNLIYQLILKKMDEQTKLFESMLNHLKYIGKEAESQTVILQRIEKLLTPTKLTVSTQEIKESDSITIDILRDIKDLLVKIENYEAFRR